MQILADGGLDGSIGAALTAAKVSLVLISLQDMQQLCRLVLLPL